MTHATRIVAVAVLVALAVGAPVQAQTPEIDALRALAEAGSAEGIGTVLHASPGKHLAFL